MQNALFKQTFSSFILLFFFLSSSFSTQPIQAEGSKELISNGGDRPFFEWREGTDINNKELYTGEILRKTTMYVYAQAGETLLLASNATGIGEADILYKAPNGTEGSCGQGVGVIENLQEERVGPDPSSGGYTPCEVIVTDVTTGVWAIDFTSPNPPRDDTNNPPPALRVNGVDTEWNRSDQPNDVNWIIAWDVSVRGTDGTIIPGRTYANYMALNMGSNSQSLNTVAHILTSDGYQYEANINGMDPYGFIFFVNNSGYTDTEGTPLYQSVPFIDNELPEGVNLHNPGLMDSERHVTQKIFLNKPDSSLPTSAPSHRGTEWLLREPLNPIGGDFAFVPYEEDNPADMPPGTFSFSSNLNGSYRIDIDLDSDSVFGNENDITLMGLTVNGANSVSWDGLDKSGAPVPIPDDSFQAQLTVQAGEIHFPFLDPEFNPNGIIITRTAPDVSMIAYYNDSNLTGLYPPDPLNATLGLDSSSGIHAFDVPDGEPKLETNGWGNERGIDTWTYYPSRELFTIVMATTPEESNPPDIPPNSGNTEDDSQILENDDENNDTPNDGETDSDQHISQPDGNETSDENSTKQDTDNQSRNEEPNDTTEGNNTTSSSDNTDSDGSDNSDESTSNKDHSNESSKVLGENKTNTLVDVGENSIPLTISGIILLGLTVLIL